ncbi:beta-1,3-galactosyltransferase 6 [Phlebotomus argentipes]|uniref:beta-1,3-galactosyltransferase 6 n=1 Tax=Phlebotomus argentipes TaxID=94469 RepID=UPI00289339C7|nr:beta-1,3-galactosyltransferase 6 [Phlebotomus argentipes]
MRSNDFNSRLLNIFIAISAFSLGTFIALMMVSEKLVDKASVQDFQAGSLRDNIAPKKPHHFLVILVATAAGNVPQRNAMRETWFKNGYLWKSDIPYDPNAVYIPLYDPETGFIRPETPDIQSYSLSVYRKWHAKYKTINPELDGQKMGNISLAHYFAIGTAGLSASEVTELKEEERKHGDILMLDSIWDSYGNLTRKLLESFHTLDEKFSFDYLLKCDDDTFVDLAILLQDLQSYHTQLKIVYEKRKNLGPIPRLYWGYFHGRAHVKTAGQWKEQNYDLCDRYLPYALGGGYVVSGNIVRQLSQQKDVLKVFKSEDISVGSWLAPFRDVYRRHDVRFDTAFMARKCQSYHIVLHKRSAEDMRHFQSGFTCSQIQNDAIRRPKEYFYNWQKPPTQCCDISVN